MKKMTLFIFFTLVSALCANASPFASIDSIKADRSTGEVKMTLSLSEGVRDFHEGSLLVLEDGSPVNYVKIRNMCEARGLDLVIAIDSSLSVREELLHRMKKYAGSMLRGGRQGDRVAVLRFNGNIRKLNGFTSDTSLIKESIASVKRSGQKTRLYDAIYDALLLFGSPKNRDGAIVVLTDGIDDVSSVTREDVLAHARKLGVALNFVSDSRGSRRLARLAKLSGGKVFNANLEHYGNLHHDLGSSGKNIYEVSYLSRAKGKGGKHSVELRLKEEAMENRVVSEFEFAGGFGLSEFWRRNIADTEILLCFLGALIFFAVIFYLARIIKKKPENEVVSLNIQEEPGVRDKCHAEYMFQERYLWNSEHPVEYPDVLYSEAWLQQYGGESPEKKIPLFRREVIIGCDMSSHVPVDDKSVSQYHARIRRIGGGFYLYDLVSDTGTYLNGKKLLMPRLLHDWDEIRVGNMVFVFRGVR